MLDHRWDDDKNVNVRDKIVVGKAADFTVLDQDIMTIPEAQILKTRNVRTIIAGELVFGAY